MVINHLSEGGSGSGNFGHTNVKGKVGGSAPSSKITFSQTGGKVGNLPKNGGSILINNGYDQEFKVRWYPDLNKNDGTIQVFDGGVVGWIKEMDPNQFTVHCNIDNHTEVVRATNRNQAVRKLYEYEQSLAPYKPGANVHVKYQSGVKKDGSPVYKEFDSVVRRAHWNDGTWGFVRHDELAKWAFDVKVPGEPAVYSAEYKDLSH